jgi:hypothetical protein
MCVNTFFFPSKQDNICLLFQSTTAGLILCLTAITKRRESVLKLPKKLIRNFDVVCSCCSISQATSLLTYKFMKCSLRIKDAGSVHVLTVDLYLLSYLHYTAFSDGTIQ